MCKCAHAMIRNTLRQCALCLCMALTEHKNQHSIVLTVAVCVYLPHVSFLLCQVCLPHTAPISHFVAYQHLLIFLLHRTKFIEALKAKFSDYNLTYSIGGQISFDVFPQVRLTQCVKQGCSKRCLGDRLDSFLLPYFQFPGTVLSMASLQNPAVFELKTVVHL